MLPALVNLLAAGAFLRLRGTRFAAAAPTWLVRCLASLGFVFGTLAVLVAVTGTLGHADETLQSAQRASIVLLFAAISAGIAFATWRLKRDVFPMALIAASTASGMLLMHWVRGWRAAPGVEGAIA